jgi:hypothetical protein
MIVTPGLAVSQMSGSVGGITASRNKGGAYFRLRAVPTTSTTVPALAAKATLAEASAAYGSLTETERDSWTRYGTIKPAVNRLGQPKILTGIAAHNQIFCRMRRAGDTPLTSPPIGPDPDALATASSTFDIGAGTTLLAFTPTPVGATNRLWLEAAVVDSPGINYVEGVKRLVVVSALDQATAYDWEAAVEAIFGPLVVGQKVVLMPSVYDSLTGQLSRPRRIDGIIVST